MAWSTPHTWLVGATVTASTMNEQLRDNMIYLKGTTGNTVLEGNLTLPADGLLILQDASTYFSQRVNTASYQVISGATIALQLTSTGPVWSGNDEAYVGGAFRSMRHPHAGTLVHIERGIVATSSNTANKKIAFTHQFTGTPTVSGVVQTFTTPVGYFNLYTASSSGFSYNYVGDAGNLHWIAMGVSTTS